MGVAEMDILNLDGHTEIEVGRNVREDLSWFWNFRHKEAFLETEMEWCKPWRTQGQTQLGASVMVLMELEELQFPH